MMRKIIHVDMDAFFASIEQHDNPKLRGKPVIVGGLSGRGVVSTCSYEARKYGVHSAMPMYMAKTLCPHGIFLPVRFQRYREVSEKVFDILYEVTDIVEPLSIDEAYLDVTDIDKNPEDIAKEIKEKVHMVTGLTVSAGVSYNKFLAKIASDWNKPDGLMIITEDMVPDILRPLSVSKVYGIGKKSSERLKKIGVEKVDDLLKLSQDELTNIFGKYGKEIYDRIRGIDSRPVETYRETKSIGKETTLKKDTSDADLLLKYLRGFADIVSSELKGERLYCRTVTVKIKTSNFTLHTRSRTLNEYIDSSDDIYSVAEAIFKEAKMTQPVRLIGLSVSNLSATKIKQLSLFDLDVKRNLKIDKILYDVNKKLGGHFVKRGSDI
ncbi:MULTISPECIES: DNA polymerase IV [Thermoanaerobacterium]|uniref:DNA polymerase IV n=1 Tax=Thermoanaerobacterium xylanolyticum (strain ATCC 49914 / DSM 7097 / LX-11) TaxID=858215 RepID=F6BKP2_THEXL|nr:DNA polymerase IV [Thermoanaerobacterium xylanolyticum]AEF18125.1 DNA polymerase IV [Thermoanaerobacterium xylanolyticum LX-11]